MTALRSLLPALAILFLAGSASAQQAPSAAQTPAGTFPNPHQVLQTVPPQSSQPLFLLNSRVILGNSVLVLNPNDIDAVKVFVDSVPRHWQSIAGSGIVVINTKRGVHVPARSLASLRRQLHVRGPVRYELDGQPLQDESLRIATQAIGQLDVRPPASGEDASTICIGLRPAAPHETPPGIYIRG